MVQNQYPIRIPTLGLKQLDLATRYVFIPQATIVTLPIKIIVTTKLPIYGHGVSIQQPKKVNSYPQHGGELPGVRPMEDRQEEDHLNGTHLEDCHQIHLLVFMDGKHLIQGYLCHHVTN
jgi:hypothetical protein